MSWILLLPWIVGVNDRLGELFLDGFGFEYCKVNSMELTIVPKVSFCKLLLVELVVIER